MKMIMEKWIEDYANLYLGCPCLNTWFPEGHSEYDKGWKLTGYEMGAQKPYFLETEDELTRTTSIKLVLRPLSDMTEEEKVRLFLWEYPNYKSGELMPSNSDTDFFAVRNENGMRCNVNLHHFSAETTKKLLSAGFDLFSLIESGLAIPKPLK